MLKKAKKKSPWSHRDHRIRRQPSIRRSICLTIRRRRIRWIKKIWIKFRPKKKPIKKKPMRKMAIITEATTADKMAETTAVIKVERKGAQTKVLQTGKTPGPGNPQR